jgi:hypothetical protein
VKKTHDYIHHYRGYWSEGGRCRIRIFREDGQSPVVICSQLQDNDNTSVTNMAEYLAAEIVQECSLPTPLIWIEHYPEHEGEVGEYTLVTFANWALMEVCLGGLWRCRVGSPAWSALSAEESPPRRTVSRRSSRLGPRARRRWVASATSVPESVDAGWALQ